MDKTCEEFAGVGADGEVRSAARESSEITCVFLPRKVAEAVAFHLLDERIAGRVCPESVERVVDRMEDAGVAVVISRALWRAMGNRQRLNWLLSSSLTDYRVGAGDGVAVLI